MYDAYTINGQVAEIAAPLTAKQGDKLKLRFINGSSGTSYDLRLAGHSLIITHTDGRPVEPFTVDVLRIAMGERYDVEVTADNPGRWQLYALTDNIVAAFHPNESRYFTFRTGLNLRFQ